MTWLCWSIGRRKSIRRGLRPSSAEVLTPRAHHEAFDGSTEPRSETSSSSVETRDELLAEVKLRVISRWTPKCGVIFEQLLTELEYFVHVSDRLGYLEEEDNISLSAQLDETARTLFGLINWLSKQIEQGKLTKDDLKPK
ncbi:MAG: hypothetical protein ACE5NP_07080 [Anaerolineae bacterium]